LARRYENFFDHLGIVEGNLASGHGGILHEVGPWGIDHRYIVLLVPYSIQ
jgi:hypothetical protein